MILNLAIFTATVATAKSKCAGNAALLRSIDRAVIEIEKAKYWSFADGVLTIISTTSGERYVIDDTHTCPARSKTCKHLVARRLMQRYFEALAFARTYAQDAHDELGCPVTLTDNQTGETLYHADESECCATA